MHDGDAPENCILATGLLRKFGADAPSLRYDDVAIPRGGITALIGTSGVGKSTLLNLIGGVDQPEFTADSKLHLMFSDGEIFKLEDGVEYPHSRTSLVFQRGYLLTNASVGLNIASTASVVMPDYSDQVGKDALGRVGLDSDYFEKRPWQISGGEAQRVGIARAMARAPQILFADEPTSNLDEVSADALMRSLKDWTQDNPEASLIWVSHDLELLFRHANRFIVMTRQEEEDGVAVVISTLRERPDTVETLRSWVSDGLVELSSVNWTKTQPTEPIEPDISPIAERLAYSEIFSKRESLTRMGKGRFSEHLARLTTQWSRGWVLPSIAAVLPAFAHKMTTALAFLSMLILSLVLAAITASSIDYAEQISDPRNCHVVIAGGDFEVQDEAGEKSILEQELKPHKITELSRRPWLAATPSKKDLLEGEIYKRSSCGDGPAVFGRRDFGKAWACDADVRAQIMVSNPSDPILTHAKIVEGELAGRSILDLTRDPKEHGFFWGGKTIFISEWLRDELVKERVSVDEGLCLQIGSRNVDFDRVEVVVGFEAPRRSRYEAFVTEAIYDIEMGVSNNEKRYSEAQVYFDPDNVEIVKEYLRQAPWNFVGDAIERTQTITGNLRSKLVVLIFFAIANVVIFLGVVFNLGTAYLSKNAPSIAVLSSFGLPQKLAASQSARELGFVLCLAFALLMILTLCCLAVFGGRYVSLSELPILSAPVFVIVAFVLHFVLVRLATKIATRNWFKLHKNRSELLG